MTAAEARLARNILELGASADGWSVKQFKYKFGRSMRQSLAGFDRFGGIVLAFETEEEAEKARSNSYFAGFSNKLRDLGLAPGLHCVVDGKDLAELPSPDPARVVLNGRDHAKIGMMPVFLIRTSLPHAKPGESEFTRTFGSVTTSMYSLPEIGVPYGPVARLLAIEIATEALTNGIRVFGAARVEKILRRVASRAVGGTGREAAHARDQLRRFCFTTAASSTRQRGWHSNVMFIGEWTTEGDAIQGFILDRHFWDLLRSGAVALDRDIVDALLHSPMAFDLYAWMSYRVPYIKGEFRAPWADLMQRIGPGHDRPEEFRECIEKHIEAIKIHWRSLDAEAGLEALILRPCPSSISGSVKETN